MLTQIFHYDVNKETFNDYFYCASRNKQGGPGDIISESLNEAGDL